MANFMNESKETKLSKARIKANNRFNAKTYDKITIMAPKGTKATIKDYAQKSGESMNTYINRAIKERIENDRNSN